MEGFMLEGRDLTKKGAYFMSSFVVSLRGGGWFHDGCSSIEISHWERKEGNPSLCVSTSDG